eukprot:8575903-Alexandrium_andersonii.AAC.1
MHLPPPQACSRTQPWRASAFLQDVSCGLASHVLCVLSGATPHRVLTHAHTLRLQAQGDDGAARRSLRVAYDRVLCEGLVVAEAALLPEGLPGELRYIGGQPGNASGLP